MTIEVQVKNLETEDNKDSVIVKQISQGDIKSVTVLGSGEEVVVPCYDKCAIVIEHKAEEEVVDSVEDAKE